MLLFFTGILSCSNGSTSVLSADTEQTLRTLSIERASELLWIGGQDINTLSIDKDVAHAAARLNIEGDEQNTALFIARSNNDEPVYPDLEGFGSLDTGNIPAPLFLHLNNLFESAKTGKISDDFFTPEEIFIKIPFEYTLSLFSPITTWIIGKPFLLEDKNIHVFEIPVRLILSEGYCDVKTYCINYDSSYKTEQIILGEWIK